MNQLTERWASIAVAWTAILIVTLLLKRWWSTGRREAQFSVIAVVLLVALFATVMSLIDWMSVSESLVEK